MGQSGPSGKLFPGILVEKVRLGEIRPTRYITGLIFDNDISGVAALISVRVSHQYGGDMDSTGAVGGYQRAGVVWGSDIKPGDQLIGEYNYAMAA